MLTYLLGINPKSILRSLLFMMDSAPERRQCKRMNVSAMHVIAIRPSVRQATQIQAIRTRKPAGCRQLTVSALPETKYAAPSANFPLQFASPVIRHPSTLLPCFTCFKLPCLLICECPPSIVGHEIINLLFHKEYLYVP